MNRLRRLALSAALLGIAAVAFGHESFYTAPTNQGGGGGDTHDFGYAITDVGSNGIANVPGCMERSPSPNAAVTQLATASCTLSSANIPKYGMLLASGTYTLEAVTCLSINIGGWAAGDSITVGVRLRNGAGVTTVASITIPDTAVVSNTAFTVTGSQQFTVTDEMMFVGIVSQVDPGIDNNFSGQCSIHLAHQ